MIRGSVLMLSLCIAIVGCVRPMEAQQPSGGIHVLSGAVVDEQSGLRVRDATVTFAFGGVEVARVQTDESGDYRYQGSLTAGLGVVRVLAVGFLPETQQFQLACSEVRTQPPYCEKKVDLYLQPADRIFEPSASECILTGTIHSGESGAVVPGALVVLEDGRTGAVADDEGRFRIPEVEAGVRLITARGIGRVSHERLILVACSDQAEPVGARFQLFTRVIW